MNPTSLICQQVIDSPNQLSPQEQETLCYHEARIRRSFLESGQSLRVIRDQRLYRAKYTSFPRYCDGEWGMSQPRAQQLISAAMVGENLITNVIGVSPDGAAVGIVLRNEAQARELVALPPEEQRAVMQEVVAAHNGKVPSARVIAQTVRQRLTQKDTEPPLLADLRRKRDANEAEQRQLSKVLASYGLAKDGFSAIEPARLADMISVAPGPVRAVGFLCVGREFIRLGGELEKREKTV